MAKIRIAAGVAALTVGLCAAANGQTTAPASIKNISICGAGTQPSTSCPNGTFDTQEIVLATGTGGVSLNDWNVPNAVDEHSSIFRPNSVGGNADYLFFVASGTLPNESTFPGSPTLEHKASDIGMVVLSGRPNKHGQWHLTFAPGYGSQDVDGNVGQVFMAPTGQRRCPSAPDRTFDLNYAAGGSVIADPTDASGHLLMLLEGANSCDSPDTKIALGIATSSDYGKHWPLYAPTATYVLPPLPYQNTVQGPDVPVELGAFGAKVCVTDCGVPTPYPGYGRYATMAPPTGEGIRDAQPAAFVDNVTSGSPVYVYSVQDYKPAGLLPDGRVFDITIARAALNGGSGPLVFEKWNGQTCDPSGAPCWTAPTSGHFNNAEEYPILKDGAFEACADPGQKRSSPSISYVESTQQYVLTFVCASDGDPHLGPNQPGAEHGAAWFFATSRDLSDPNQWGVTAPVEIIGSWNPFSPADFYDGWYPTFMSLDHDQARLASRGFAFYLWGCEGGGCGGRHFATRRFTIQTTDNAYSRPPRTTIVDPPPPLNSTGTVTFTFRSNEAGSAFECALDSQSYAPCQSPATFGLAVGANTFSVRAINPFGMIGRAATTKVTYKPLPINQ